MGLRILNGRNGQHRGTWYGRYTDRDGKLVEENLQIKICGKPPRSLSDKGDPEFERSRGRALHELKRRKEVAGRNRTVKADAVRDFKRSTGSDIKQTELESLPEVLAVITPQRQSPVWFQWRQKVIWDFVHWARQEKIRCVLDVEPADAKRYLLQQYQPDKLGYQKTVATVRKIKNILGRVFASALEEGATNPFRHADVSIDRAEGDSSHTRKPLTEIEVGRLLQEAKTDRMVYDMIVCGLCTGLRRGDVARLKWESVDLRNGSIDITTRKTGTLVSIPILRRLREVFEGRLAERTIKEKYVFPDAKRVIDSKPAQLSYRIKRVFARALSDGIEDSKQATDAPERVNLKDVLPRVLKSIEATPMLWSKRQKMTDLVKRYEQGETYRVIQRATGISRGGISGLLHEAERISGQLFIVDKRPVFSIKKAIATMTREEREFGSRAASTYDFHALRTSFVTIAITGGIPVEIVKAITGHKLVETIITHYLKPKGSVFYDKFMTAMPAVLTGRNTESLPAPKCDRLKAITDAMTLLSKDEKAKLKKLISS